MTAAVPVEIRVPVSPTVDFALMLRVLHASLVKNALLSNFRMTAVIGAGRVDWDASQAMSRWLAPDIESVIVEPEQFEADGVHATARLRLAKPSDADVIILMDSDTIICGALDKLCDEIMRSPAVCGVIAHTTPRFSTRDWKRAYKQFGLKPPEFPYRYSGWPDMAPRWQRQRNSAFAPPYFNYGFVATTAPLLESLQRHVAPAMALASNLRPLHPVARLRAQRSGQIFQSQIGLTLAIERANVPHRSIGVRYNFPNDLAFERLHPKELENVSVVHLLRRSPLFDKQTAYRSIEALRRFVDTDTPEGALRRARQTFLEVLPVVESHGLPYGLAEPAWTW